MQVHENSKMNLFHLLKDFYGYIILVVLDNIFACEFFILLVTQRIFFMMNLEKILVKMNLLRPKHVQVIDAFEMMMLLVHLNAKKILKIFLIQLII